MHWDTGLENEALIEALQNERNAETWTETLHSAKNKPLSWKLLRISTAKHLEHLYTSDSQIRRPAQEMSQTPTR